MTKKPKPYTGVFAEPSAELLEGAIGWRHESVSDPDRPGRWKPTGFMVIYPDHVLRTGMDEVPYRDSVLHAP